MGKNALHNRIQERDWAGALDWIQWYVHEGRSSEVTASALRAMVLFVSASRAMHFSVLCFELFVSPNLRAARLLMSALENLQTESNAGMGQIGTLGPILSQIGML